MSDELDDLLDAALERTGSKVRERGRRVYDRAIAKEIRFHDFAEKYEERVLSELDTDMHTILGYAEQTTKNIEGIVITAVTPQSQLITDQNKDSVITFILNYLLQAKYVTDEDLAQLIGQERTLKGTEDVVFASNPVYLMNLGERSVVLKFDDSEIEHTINSYLHENGVTSPKPITFKPINIDGEQHTVYISEFVTGISFSEMIKDDFMGDENHMCYFRDSVTQLARIQDRGIKGETEGMYTLKDVVADDDQYFTNRVRKTFAGQTRKFLEGILKPEGIEEFDRLSQELVNQYERVNAALVEASKKDTVYYSDHSPNNMICNEDGTTTQLDLGSGRKLLGMFDFISLTEFGRIKADYKFVDYLGNRQKDRLFEQYLLERKIEQSTDETEKARIRAFIETHKDDTFGYRYFKTKAEFDTYISETEFKEATRTRWLASLHRHLEYIGYAQRDISNAPEDTELIFLDGNKRNELHRQEYHLHMAKEAITELNKLTLTLHDEDVYDLSFTLQKIEFVLKKQTYPQYLR